MSEDCIKDWIDALMETNNLKGGQDKMETKSRYEVIAELEEKKRNLIVSKNGLNDKLNQMERELKDLKRQLEDQEEEIAYFKENKAKQEETYDELIKSTDESLKRFSEINSGKK